MGFRSAFKHFFEKATDKGLSKISTAAPDDKKTETEPQAATNATSDEVAAQIIGNPNAVKIISEASNEEKAQIVEDLKKAGVEIDEGDPTAALVKLIIPEGLVNFHGRIRKDKSQFAPHPWTINPKKFHELYNTKYAEIGVTDPVKLRMLKMYFPPIHSQVMLERMEEFDNTMASNWDYIFMIYHPQSKRFNHPALVQAIKDSYIKDANLEGDKYKCNAEALDRFVRAAVIWEIFHPDILTSEQKQKLNDQILSDVFAFNSFAWKTMDYGIKDMTGANLNQEIEHIELFRNLSWLFKLQKVHLDIVSDFEKMYHKSVAGLPRMGLGDGAHRYNSFYETSYPYELRITNNLIYLWTHSWDPVENPDPNYKETNKNLRDQIREKANMFILGSFQIKATKEIPTLTKRESKSYLPLIITSGYPYVKYQNDDLIDRWTSMGVYMLTHMLGHNLLIHSGPGKMYIQFIIDKANRFHLMDFHFLMFIHRPHIDELIMHANPEESPLWDNYAYFNRNFLGGMGKFGDWAYMINGRIKVDVDSDMHFHRNTSVGFLVSKGQKDAWSCLSTIKFSPGIVEDVKKNEPDCIANGINSTITTTEFSSLGQTMKDVIAHKNVKVPGLLTHEVWITTQKGAFGLMVCDPRKDPTPDKMKYMRLNGIILENCGNRYIAYYPYDGGPREDLKFVDDSNTLINSKLEIKLYDKSISGNFKTTEMSDCIKWACVVQHFWSYQEPYDSAKGVQHVLVGVKSIDTNVFSEVEKEMTDDYLMLSFKEGERKYIGIYNCRPDKALECKMIALQSSDPYWIYKSGAKYRPDCLDDLEITGEWMLIPQVNYGGVKQNPIPRPLTELIQQTVIPPGGHVVLVSAVGEKPKTGGPGFEIQLPIASFPFFPKLNMELDDTSGSNMLMTKHDLDEFVPGWAVFNGKGYLEAKMTEKIPQDNCRSVFFWVEPAETYEQGIVIPLYTEGDWLKIWMDKGMLVINDKIRVVRALHANRAIMVGVVIDENGHCTVSFNAFHTEEADLSPPPPLESFTLGGNPGGDHFFKGRMRNVMVWDKAVTPEETKVLSKRTAPRGYNEFIFQPGGIPPPMRLWLNDTYFGENTPTNKPMTDIVKYLMPKDNVLLIESVPPNWVFQKPKITVGGYEREITWRIGAYTKKETYSKMKYYYQKYEKDQNRLKQDRFFKFFELEFLLPGYDDSKWDVIQFDDKNQFKVPAYPDEREELFIRGEFIAVAVDAEMVDEEGNQVKEENK